MLISKIYHSREDRVAELQGEDERIQYDGKDDGRINDVIDAIDEYTNQLCGASDTLLQSEDDEELEYNRRNFIERWALAQAALSKAAWVLRFDGNKAYERMINALKTGSAADMRGL